MKAYDWLKWILIPLFIVYITLYITQATGYYEYEQHKKSVVTAEKIDQFEKDVASGKKIKIEDYVVGEKNYHNKFSNTGLKLSQGIEKIVQSGLKSTFKVLGALFDE